MVYISYAILQIVLSGFPLASALIQEEVETRILLIFFAMSILTWVCYGLVACTNPGYVLGSSSDEARRAGAYDPKMYAVGDQQLGFQNQQIAAKEETKKDGEQKE